MRLCEVGCAWMRLCGFWRCWLGYVRTVGVAGSNHTGFGQVVNAEGYGKLAFPVQTI